MRGVYRPPPFAKVIDGPRGGAQARRHERWLRTGDGPRDLSNVGALADTHVAEGRRTVPRAEPGRWPGARIVVRVLFAAAAAIVVLGWVVTAVRGAA